MLTVGRKNLDRVNFICGSISGGKRNRFVIFPAWLLKKPGQVKKTPPHLSLSRLPMRTFIRNVNGVLVIKVTHICFYGKESHLFIFAQSVLNYSIPFFFFFFAKLQCH